MVYNIPFDWLFGSTQPASYEN